jgi:phospholipid-binding lipoprotein MlaA
MRRGNRPFRSPRRTGLLGCVGCLALVLSGCATVPTDPAGLAEYKHTNDPLEPTNRVFYEVSDTVDTYTLRPVAQAYVWAVPEPGRTGIHNALMNLASPAVFFNDVFETKPRRAGDTFMRFLINSTIGIGGVLDVATGWGYKARPADGGMTLAAWGLPQGPYLFLPLIGPSSPRDATGFGMDIALAPLTYVPRGYGLITLNWVLYGTRVVDSRAQVLADLDQLKKNALDPYASIRSLYRQHRNAEIQAMRDDNRTTVPDWYSN